MAYKSKYNPINTRKYMGDPANIVCRSMWERKMCKYLDTNQNVLRWGSEEIAVPYYSPVDKKVHRYYPDFIVEKKTNDGKSVETLMIEVKPFHQTKPPQKKKKSRKTLINETITYEVNQAKWKYATDYCKRNGWKFVILTEKDIFPQHK